MRTIAILNVKGGVGKTTTTVNMAYILAHKYNKKVLVIDLDKQANATISFKCYDETVCVGEAMANENADVSHYLKKTPYENIDVLPANMSFITWNKRIFDMLARETLLKGLLEKLEHLYDFCIIDCPTDLNISVTNALCTADDVIIPMKIDNYSESGIKYVLDEISKCKRLNPKLNLCGCFINMYQRSILYNSGVDAIKEQPSLKPFNTLVRSTVRVSESTYIQPVVEYDEKCTASQDFLSLVDEYLNRISETNN